MESTNTQQFLKQSMNYKAISIQNKLNEMTETIVKGNYYTALVKCHTLLLVDINPKLSRELFMLVDKEVTILRKKDLYRRKKRMEGMIKKYNDWFYMLNNLLYDHYFVDPNATMAEGLLELEQGMEDHAIFRTDI